MKKALAILLLSILLFTTACGGEVTGTTPSETTPAETEPTNTTPAVTTPVDTRPAQTTPSTPTVPEPVGSLTDPYYEFPHITGVMGDTIEWRFSVPDKDGFEIYAGLPDLLEIISIEWEEWDGYFDTATVKVRILDGNRTSELIATDGTMRRCVTVFAEMANYPIDPNPTATTPAETTPAVTTPVVTDQYMKNPMTGEASDKDYSTLRPVAIFISNQTSVIGKQYGISEADVIYEFLAEGGVTRLLMLTYAYDNSVQFGPVRSARDYALDFAIMHDAISIHAGGSFEAYLKISSAALDTIDGTNNTDAAEYFYYVSQGLPSYNSYMINGSDIARAIRSVRGVYNNALARLNSSAASTSYFKFADDGKFTGGTGDSNKISITYLASSFGTASGVTSLTYNSEDGKYYKFIDEAPQTDANNGKQLAFENVLILKTKTTRISRSVISIDITTGGSGYYCNGGKYITIYWTYNADTAQIELTSTSGETLEMATGKTLVSIVSNESVGIPSLVELN
jgi:hypothetical protein